jgi:hypothetical protein
VIKTLPLPNLAGSVSELDIPSSVRTIALWADDPEYFTSALTDVVSVR